MIVIKVKMRMVIKDKMNTVIKVIIMTMLLLIKIQKKGEVMMIMMKMATMMKMIL